MRNLLAKELAEHRIALVVLSLFLVTYFAILLGSAALIAGPMSILAQLLPFVRFGGFTAALIVCHRLITREIANGTHLFLETLPVGRIEILSAKLIFGLAYCGLVMCSAIAVGTFLGATFDTVTPRFVAIMTARALTFELFIFSLHFAMSFLGRYLTPLWIMIVLVIVVLERQTKLDLVRFSPFALVDDTFAYERTAFPLAHIATTFAISLSCLATGLLLGLVREGSVSDGLSQKMTQREKVFVAVIFAAAIISMTILESKVKKPLFDLADATSFEEEGVVVKIVPTEGPDEQERAALAERTHRALAEMKSYLGLDSVAPVFIISGAELAPDHFIQGRLGRQDGLVVRIGRPGPSFDEAAFITWVVREVLLIHSNGRAELEPRYWLLDGFSAWWAKRSTASLGDRTLMLRALYAAPNALSKHELERWVSVRERFGEGVASGIGWSLLHTIERTRGKAALGSFLRAALGPRVPDDVRALWQTKSLDRILIDEAGIAYPELLAEWKRDLEAARAELEPDLALIPRPLGEIEVERLSEATCVVRYKLTAPKTGDVAVKVEYLKLDFFDEELDPDDIRVAERKIDRAQIGDALPDTFPTHARFAWSIAMHSDALACDVISGWKRQELE